MWQLAREVVSALTVLRHFPAESHSLKVPRLCESVTPLIDGRAYGTPWTPPQMRLETQFNQQTLNCGPRLCHPACDLPGVILENKEMRNLTHSRNTYMHKRLKSVCIRSQSKPLVEYTHTHSPEVIDELLWNLDIVLTLKLSWKGQGKGVHEFWVLHPLGPIKF